jgi:hypothetical protein
MLWLWQYWNDALHENDTKKVAQFKLEATCKGRRPDTQAAQFTRKTHAASGTRQNITT